MHRRRDKFNIAHKLMKWDMIGSDMHRRRDLFNTAHKLMQWAPDESTP